MVYSHARYSYNCAQETSSTAELDATMAQWTVDSAKWRSQLQVPQNYAPYSAALDTEAAGLGKRASKRVLDLIDCSVLEICKRHKVTLGKAKPYLKNKLLDVSQSHGRRPMSNAEDIAKALTTSSRLFSFDQKRLLCAEEHLALQGYDFDFEVPEAVSASELRKMAGEGIALPCLACILWALRLTQPFD